MIMEYKPPQGEEEQKNTSPTPIPIKGRFDQYRSSFWAAAIAVLSTRYGVRPLVRHLWDNPQVAKQAVRVSKEAPKQVSHYVKHIYAAAAGVIMYGVTGYYAKKTYDDMRSIFAEAVGAEFDKRPEDVTRKDIWASKNSA